MYCRNQVLALFIGLLVQGRAAFPEGAQQALQKIVENKSATYNCAISVAMFDGKSTLTAVAGVTNFDTNESVAPEDKFLWGSGTKPLTGASILKLVEEGKLKLSDKVTSIVDPYLAYLRTLDPSQNFSSLGDLWGEENISFLTVHNLATMTYPTPDFDTAKPSMHGEAPTDSFRAEAFANPGVSYSPTKLMSAPWVAGHWVGSPRGYSSTNFMLLGMVLAAKSNASSWDTYNQGDVLPQDLRGEFNFGLKGAPNDFSRIHGYDRTSYNMPVGKVNDKDVAGVDGVLSGWTASDSIASPTAMAKLYWDIYGPRPSIASTSSSVMATGHHDQNQFYGFATFGLSSKMGQNNSYGDAWGHIGATYGYDSIVVYFPKLSFVIAVATNMENDGQLHPIDTSCTAYNAIAGMILDQEADCRFVENGYYRSGCQCEHQFATPDAVMV